MKSRQYEPITLTIVSFGNSLFYLVAQKATDEDVEKIYKEIYRKKNVKGKR